MFFWTAVKSPCYSFPYTKLMHRSYTNSALASPQIIDNDVYHGAPVCGIYKWCTSFYTVLYLSIIPRCCWCPKTTLRPWLDHEIWLSVSHSSYFALHHDVNLGCILAADCTIQSSLLHAWMSVALAVSVASIKTPWDPGIRSTAHSYRIIWDPGCVQPQHHDVGSRPTVPNIDSYINSCWLDI